LRRYPALQRGVHDPDKLDRTACPARVPTGNDYSTIAATVRGSGEYARRPALQAISDFHSSNGRFPARETWKKCCWTLLTDDPVYLELECRHASSSIFRMHEQILQAGGGRNQYHALAARILGTSAASMIGMDIFERHLPPSWEQYFAMVHRYGAKTMMHQVGSAALRRSFRG